MDAETVKKRHGLVGDSRAIQQVLEKVAQVAPTKINVLLRGESGVGKDVMARVIHGLSDRKDKKLIIVNCGAIPEGIIESELFGHEKGSFTGAHEARQGYFEMANGGTIFLDEIGDTPKNVQVKLLRILENGEYYRVGSSDVRKTDVRIITATNRDLWKDVQDGHFREDLYYRLDTVTVHIPPLRERQEDIIPIFRNFVTEFAAKYDSVFQGFADEARELLISYRWPGNIRELRNVAEQLVVLEKSQFITPEILQKYLKGRQRYGQPDNLPVPIRHAGAGSGDSTGSDDRTLIHDREMIYRALIDLRGEISDLKKMMGSFIYGQYQDEDSHRSVPLLPSHIPAKSPSPAEAVNSDIPLGINKIDNTESQDADHEDIEDFQDLNSFFSKPDEIPSIEEAEKFLIKKALERYEGNRRKAADALGMSERTLYRKLDQYDLI